MLFQKVKVGRSVRAFLMTPVAINPLEAKTRNMICKNRFQCNKTEIGALSPQSVIASSFLS